MKKITSEQVQNAYDSIKKFSLPAWREIPDLDMYMDQVISLINRYFENYPGYDEKGLTPSMVNNYVKHNIIPAPVNKKYTRSHLACLIIICILKTTLPISLVGKLIEANQESSSSYQEMYEKFYNAFHLLVTATTKFPKDSVNASDILLSAALHSHMEQSFALCLLKELSDEEKTPKEVKEKKEPKDKKEKKEKKEKSESPKKPAKPSASKK